MFVMYYDVYLKCLNFLKQEKVKSVSYLLAMLENTINKLT